MGTIYSPPKEAGPTPDFKVCVEQGYAAYNKLVDEYVNKVSAWAKANGSGECAGEEVRFQYADGQACYVVLSLKPVKLIHLPISDGYEYPYIERLTAKDIKQAVRRERGLAKLFGKE